VLALLQASELPYQDINSYHMRYFLLARDSMKLLVGVIGLEPYGQNGLLRSLVVHSSLRNQGLGQMLVRHLEGLARSLNIQELYLLTTTATDFFARLEYLPTVREQAPAELQATSEFRSLCPSTAVCMKKGLSE
jgi:amino-acid N-acetyltransferase